MSDLFGYGPSFSFSGGVSGPGVSKELRQRIALAMLMQKRKAPSTFGEGLSAIGDSLGDIGTMRRLAAEENAGFASANTKADELLGTTPPVGAQGPSPVQAAAISAPSSLYQPPDQDPRSQAPVPPTVQEGGPTPTNQPMFRPNLRTATPPAQALPPAAPAVPAPPDVPGATRMSTPAQMADFRAQNPLPQNIPPMPPPGGPPPGMPPQPAAPARPSVADYGQKLALAPTPQDQNASPLDNMPWPHGNVGAPPPGAPVMAQGPDPTKLPMMSPEDQQRNDIAMAAFRQKVGASPSTPAPPPPPPYQGIAAAPPAAPIQKMPPPEGPQPGYVSQPLKPVIAPMPEPMSKHEADLREAIARDPDGANGQLARRLGPVIQTLESNRTAINQRNIEKYKLDLAAEIARNQNIEAQKTGAAKDVADVAHTKVQTRKESIIENPEEKYMMGPDGVVRPIRVEGENPNAMPSGKLTEDQRKTLVYHGWAKSGNQAITGNDNLLAHGLYQEALGKIPAFGNQAQDDAYRRAKNGADNFILSFMRSTSGAQYGANERLDHAKAMLPRQGDDAKTLADKAAARQQFIDSEYAGLGKQGQKMADHLAKTYDPGSAENKQRLIDIEMQGVKGTQVGEVKTNKNPKSPYFGKSRIWNGSRWVEE